MSIENMKNQAKYLREATNDLAELIEFAERWVYLNKQVPGAVVHTTRSGSKKWKIRKDQLPKKEKATAKPKEKQNENDKRVAKNVAKWADKSSIHKETKDMLAKDASELTDSEAREQLSHLRESNSQRSPGAEFVQPGSKTATKIAARVNELMERFNLQPWQRTQKSVIGATGIPPHKHKEMVAKALSQGKQVPPEVLADYPDLAKAKPKEAAKKKDTGLTIEELRRRLGWDLPSPEPKSSGLTPVRSGEREPFKHPTSGKIGHLPGKPLSNLDKTSDDGEIKNDSELNDLIKSLFEQQYKKDLDSERFKSETPEKQKELIERAMERTRNEITKVYNAIKEKDPKMAINGTFHPSNSRYRKLFEDVTGEKLPSGANATVDFLKNFVGKDKIDSYFKAIDDKKAQEQKAKEEKEKREYEQSINSIKEKIKSGEQISGDDLVEAAKHFKIDIHPRTVGMLRKRVHSVNHEGAKITGRASIGASPYSIYNKIKGMLNSSPASQANAPEAKSTATEQAKPGADETIAKQPEPKKEPWEMTKEEFGLSSNPIHKSVADLLEIIEKENKNENAKRLSGRFLDLQNLPISISAAKELEKRGLAHLIDVKTTPKFGKGIDVVESGKRHIGLAISKKGEESLSDYKKHEQYSNAIDEAIENKKDIPSSILNDSPKHLEKALSQYSPSDNVPSWGDLAESPDGDRGIVKQKDSTLGLGNSRRVVLTNPVTKKESYHTLGELRRLLPKIAKPDDSPKEGDRNAEGLVFRDGRWHREGDPQEINYAHAITIAADNIKELRKPDVYRVIDSMQNQKDIDGMARYITENRPELKDEVRESLLDIYQERKYSGAGAEPKSEDESARDASPESNLGRTDGSIPPTGANTPMFDYEQEKAKLHDRVSIEKQKKFANDQAEILESDITSLKKQRKEIFDKLVKLKDGSPTKKTLEAKHNGIKEELSRIENELEHRNKSIRAFALELAMHDADPIQMDALKVQEKGIYGDNRKEANDFFKKYSVHFAKELESRGVSKDEANSKGGVIAHNMLHSASMRFELNYKQSIDLAAKKYKDDSDFESIKSDFKSKYPHANIFNQQGLIRQAIDEPDRRDELLGKADSLYKQEHDAVAENVKKEKEEREKLKIANSFKTSMANTPPKNVTPAKLISMVKKQWKSRDKYDPIKTMKETGWVPEGRFLVKATAKDMKQIDKEPITDKRLVQVDPILELAKPNKNPVQIVGGFNHEDGHTYILLRGEDGTEARVDAQYFDVIRSRYPNAKIFFNGSHKHNQGKEMIVFQDNGETVGIVMPCINSNGKGFHKLGTHDVIDDGNKSQQAATGTDSKLSQKEHEDSTWKNHLASSLPSRLSQIGKHDLAEKEARILANKEHEKIISNAALNGENIPDFNLKQYPHLDSKNMQSEMGNAAKLLESQRNAKNQLREAKNNTKKKFDDYVHGEDNLKKQMIAKAKTMSLEDFLGDHKDVSEATINKIKSEAKSLGKNGFSSPSGTLNLPTGAANRIAGFWYNAVSEAIKNKEKIPKNVADDFEKWSSRKGD